MSISKYQCVYICIIVIHETLNSLVSDVYNINILFSRKYSIGHEYIDTKYYLDNDDQYDWSAKKGVKRTWADLISVYTFVSYWYVNVIIIINRCKIKKSKCKMMPFCKIWDEKYALMVCKLLTIYVLQ